MGGPAGAGGGPAPGGNVVTMVIPGWLGGLGAPEEVGGVDVRVGCWVVCCVGCWVRVGCCVYVGCCV